MNGKLWVTLEFNGKSYSTPFEVADIQKLHDEPAWAFEALMKPTLYRLGLGDSHRPAREVVKE